MTKKSILLFGFIALKFLLHTVLISSDYDLQRDEFLHLDQANHLAWGFLSVPPLTSWTSYLIQLLGNSIFWIKFFPALYGALTILVVWQTIEFLNGNLFALALGATCVLFSAVLRINILYQPNSFDVLCWTTLYYLLVVYTKTERSYLLYALAVVFALGFFNKYNVVFLVFGLLPALVLTQQRKIFKRSHLYYAALLVLVLISPNLFWQYQNGFPVFHHLKQLSEQQLVYVDRMEFIKSQFLFFIGGIVLLVASLFALIFYQPFKPYRYMAWSIVFTLLIFIYFKAKDYYAIGIYPVYLAFGAVYLGDKLAVGRKKYLQPVLLALPLLFFIPVVNVFFSVRNPEYIQTHAEPYIKFGLLRWEDGKNHILPQDFADMLGWRELAHKVDSAFDKLTNQEQTIIICDNYGQAGAINYYTKKNLRAVSFNADYVNWFDLSIEYKHLIRVKEAGDRNIELQETSKYFTNSYVTDSVTNVYAREYGTTIFVFENAKIDIRKRLSNEINEVKSY
jgi:hypothetical protein